MSEYNINLANDGKPGRKSKLTKERHDRIVELIKIGNYVEVACAATGITERSYYHWVAIGRDIIDAYGPEDEDWPTTLDQHQRNCARFFQAIKQASAEAEAYAVGVIRKQMPQQWTAAMTWLERRHPGRWKRRDELAVANPFEVQGQSATGIDEQALLQDPDAVRLVHEALAAVATTPGLMPPVQAEVVESTAEEA